MVNLCQFLLVLVLVGGLQIETTENGEVAVNNSPMRTLHKALTTITAQAASSPGMSETCLNNMCLMFEAQLSCKAFGIHLYKTCAQYLLGFSIGCPIFPSPADIYNAPYACVEQLGDVLGGVNFSSSTGIIPTYLDGDFSTNCQRNCFQTYLNASNLFYSTCSSQISNVTTPAAYQLSNFIEFRNQVCAANAQGQNCYDLAQQTTGGSLPIFTDYTCSYLNQPGVGPSLCSAFQSTGCCFGNIIALVDQNQVSASNLKVFPPCLLRYLSTACPASANPTAMCTLGANGNMTVVQAKLTLTTAAATANANSIKFLPNMYNLIATTAPPCLSAAANCALLYLQGALVGSLAVPAGTGSLTSAQLTAFGLNSKKPFTVEVTNYAYFNGTAATGFRQMSTASGLPYSPAGGDYSAKATRVVVTFQFTVQGLNEAEAVQLFNAVKNPAFGAVGIATAYGAGTAALGTANAGAAVTVISTSPAQFVAEPYITYKSAAAGGDRARVRGAVGLVLVAAMALSVALGVVM